MVILFYNFFKSVYEFFESVNCIKNFKCVRGIVCFLLMLDIKGKSFDVY